MLRAIYDSSLSNLVRAIREMDSIAVYDNGEHDTAPRVLPQAEGGHVVYIAAQYLGVAGTAARGIVSACYISFDAGSDPSRRFWAFTSTVVGQDLTAEKHIALIGERGVYD